METEHAHGEKTVNELLAALMRLGADKRQPAAEIITELQGRCVEGRKVSLRYIARETGLPKTTLARWVAQA